jgi:hypothetical protein
MPFLNFLTPQYIAEKRLSEKIVIMTAKRCGQSGQQTRQYPNYIHTLPCSA